MFYWITKYRFLGILVIAITVCVPQAVFATGVTNAARQHSPQETVNSIDAQEIETLPPAGLDPTTIELFTGAVSDLHETAKNLNGKLARIEDRSAARELESSAQAREDRSEIARRNHVGFYETEGCFFGLIPTGDRNGFPAQTSIQFDGVLGNITESLDTCSSIFYTYSKLS